MHAAGGPRVRHYRLVKSLPRAALVVLAALTAASTLVALWAAFVVAPDNPWFGNDAHAYWAVTVEGMYANGLAPNRDAFLYPPPAGLVAATFDILPYDVFHALWRLLQVGVLVGLAGPLAGPLALLPLVGNEIAVGNISLLMAGAVVLGFRWPAAWAFVLLTKVTPGVGLLWFAVRREWRSLAIALGVSGALAAVTIPLFPGLWADWIDLMVASLRQAPPDTAAAVPFVVRLALGALVVVIGALTDRPWTVPLAVMLGHAHLWSSVGSILVACIPLVVFPRIAGPRRRIRPA